MAFACPHESASLSIQEVEGHIGYLCKTCHGAWLPRKYLQSIEHLRNFSHADLLVRLAAQAQFRTALTCPENCGPMHGKSFKGIDIEYCPKCQGIWFDRGEIDKLLSHYGVRGGGSGGGVDVLDIADLASSLFDLFN